jgi:Flp pilus assembly protein TadD
LLNLSSLLFRLPLGSEYPPNAALLLDLGRVAYKEKDYQGALGYLAHARDLEPRNPAIHFFFGVVLIEMDLPLEAEGSLSLAAELDGRNPYVAYALGAVKSQMRKWDEAVDWFERYCTLKPDDPHGKLALASAYFATMADDCARRLAEAALKDPDTAAAARYYLGRLALRANDFDAGVAELRQAVALNPKHAEAWSELGFVYLERIAYGIAGKALERSIALNPDSFLANMRLLILYKRQRDPRVAAQAERVAKLDAQRSEKASDMLRAVRVQPY